MHGAGWGIPDGRRELRIRVHWDMVRSGGACTAAAVGAVLVWVRVEGRGVCGVQYTGVLGL